MPNSSKPQIVDKYSSPQHPEEWLCVEPVLSISTEHIPVYSAALLQAMTRPSAQLLRCITFTIELSNNQSFTVAQYCADLPGVDYTSCMNPLVARINKEALKHNLPPVRKVSYVITEQPLSYVVTDIAPRAMPNSATGSRTLV